MGGMGPPQRTRAERTELGYHGLMRLPDGKVQKRRKSCEIPGHAHELTFCCQRRYPFLSKDRTREWFVDALDQARHKHDLELWAYIIMPEHAHVLFLPRRSPYSIARILKAIKQPVAQKAVNFLRRTAPQWLDRLTVTWPTGRVEHRFWEQGGGYDRNILDARTAWLSVKYIHNNPVRRGLVATAEEWLWSSAGWYAGERDVKLPMDACPPDPPLTR